MSDQKYGPGPDGMYPNEVKQQIEAVKKYWKDALGKVCAPIATEQVIKNITERLEEFAKMGYIGTYFTVEVDKEDPTQVNIAFLPVDPEITITFTLKKDVKKDTK